jgi:hypothetical protein
LPADFWRLWSAATISGAGDGVRVVALPLLAAGLTRDPRAVSLVAVAAGLPWLLSALPAGALVDRWDRKRVLWSVDFARAAVMAGLVVGVALGHASIPLLLVVAFLLGSAQTLFDSAAQAALPVVVPRPDLERANGRLGTVALAVAVSERRDCRHENPPPAPCSCSAIGLRRLPLPTRRHRPRGPLVPALRPVLPRRRRTPGRARHPGRPRHHLPLGPPVHAAPD